MLIGETPHFCVLIQVCVRDLSSCGRWLECDGCAIANCVRTWVFGHGCWAGHHVVTPCQKVDPFPLFQSCGNSACASNPPRARVSPTHVLPASRGILLSAPSSKPTRTYNYNVLRRSPLCLLPAPLLAYVCSRFLEQGVNHDERPTTKTCD